jgi:CubicO group peptidase (beta-lactamase class C family)
MLCDARPRTRPGRLLAYHAVTGGFLLAEVVRRATGSSLPEVLEGEIRDPLGLRWLQYGVKPEDVDKVALNAVTGPPAPPPLSWILGRALGAPLPEVVALSNDPRFLTGLIPSANVVSTAADMATFFQCLLSEGEFDGVRIFEPRTLHHAIDEQSAWEFDLTLMLPIGYSLGFMLGNHYLSPFGWNHPRAFGHLGLSNVFCWADPERELVVSLLTTGKPIASLHILALARLFSEVHECFPKIRHRARRDVSSGVSSLSVG